LIISGCGFKNHSKSGIVTGLWEPVKPHFPEYDWESQIKAGDA